MACENFMSKTEDVVWLAYQLKNKLGDKISINKIGLYKEVLEGKYNLNGRDFYAGGSIYFGILYSNKEFLRIFVGEIGTSLSSYEDKLVVLNELKNAISNIVRDGVSLGEPSVFYNVRDEEYMIPHLEYIYSDKENYIKSFEDKTIFDDGGVPEDVIIFDITKNNEEFVIAKSYSYITPDTQCRYSIGIYAMVKNKSDIEEREIRNLIIENLDELFNNFNESLLNSYVTSNNDITYITAYIKNALSFVEETELCIDIKRNGTILAGTTVRFPIGTCLWRNSALTVISWVLIINPSFSGNTARARCMDIIPLTIYVGRRNIKRNLFRIV